MEQAGRRQLDSRTSIMNIVLYTQDFEPITVIDLPMWLLDKIDSEGYVKVAVPKRRLGT